LKTTLEEGDDLLQEALRCLRVVTDQLRIVFKANEFESVVVDGKLALL
jgi:hypothetical protein